MFDGLSVRNAIDGRPVTVGEHEDRLHVVAIREDADGGATLTIAISGSRPGHLQLNVSEAVLQDPIALR
jgi:hypothetical protein